jgi:hypothetical protein
MPVDGAVKQHRQQKWSTAMFQWSRNQTGEKTVSLNRLFLLRACRAMSHANPKKIAPFHKDAIPKLLIYSLKVNYLIFL